MSQPNLPPVDNFHPLNPETLGIPHQALEHRAYELYLEAGSPEGRGHEHWTQAVSDLLAGYLPRTAERREVAAPPPPPAPKRRKSAESSASAPAKKAGRPRKKS